MRELAFSNRTINRIPRVVNDAVAMGLSPHDQTARRGQLSVEHQMGGLHIMALRTLAQRPTTSTRETLPQSLGLTR